MRRAVPGYLAVALLRLQGFRTPEEHALRLTESGEAPDARAGLELLGALRQEGLLLSRSGFLRALPPPDHETPSGSASIQRIAWITRDRPESLIRTLETFHQGLEASGREPGLMVVDDGRDPVCRADLRRGLTELTEGTGRAVSYVGPEERTGFEEDLAEACRARGVQDGLVRFALRPPEGVDFAPGAARNAAILLGAGVPLLLCDDDVLCRAVVDPDGPDPDRLTSRHDPTEFLALGEEARGILQGGDPGRGAVLSDRRPDVLRSHEALLGRTVGDVEPEDLRGLDRSLAHHLTRFGGSVRITTPGLAGDSGMEYPVGLLRVEGPGREDLTWSREEYEAAVTSRQAIRYAGATSLVRGGMLMGPQLGLDLRVPLPPFLPGFRNGDGVFGATVRAVRPTALTAHLPWAPVHEPPHDRGFGREEIRGFHHRVSSLVLVLLKDAAEGAGDAEEAMERVGSRLVEAARRPAGDFRERLEDIWLQEVESYLATLEALLERNGHEPEYWARDVEAHMESAREHMIAGNLAVPPDLETAAGGGEGRGLEAGRTLVGRFGELIRAWPTILEVARELRRGDTK